MSEARLPLSQDVKLLDVSYIDWFHHYFPSSYVVAMGESGALKEGHSDLWLDIEEEMERYRKINMNGGGIFFTPNAVKTKEERHRLSNFHFVNAWYIDLDIDGAKAGSPDEIRKIREDKKAEMRGKIMFAPLMPSFTIENRNGFHLYWMAGSSSGSHSFAAIEAGLVHYFRNHGADRSSTKLVTLLRVPGTFNNKNDECFPVQIDPNLSQLYEDKSPWCYKEEEMLLAFPAPEVPANEIEAKVYVPPRQYVQDISADGNQLFDRVHSFPIADVLAKLSGGPLVKGELINFRPVAGGKKINVYINNQPTSNFIDCVANHIYGKRDTEHNGPTVTQWLRYYGWSYRELAEEYKRLFGT